MITYKTEVVKDNLKEICGKFTMTKDLKIKAVKYTKSSLQYTVTLEDMTNHRIGQELINQYIESLGDKKGLEIASLLVQEEIDESKNYPSLSSINDDAWEGDINDVRSYIDKKKDS